MRARTAIVILSKIGRRIAALSRIEAIQFPSELRYPTPFGQISAGRASSGPRKRGGHIDRLELRLFALKFCRLGILGKWPTHRYSGTVASASIDHKPVDRGGTGHDRQSAVDQAGDHSQNREADCDLCTSAESSIRIQAS